MKCVYHAYFGIKLVEKELILVDYSPHLSPQKELNDLACKVLCWDEDLRKKKVFSKIACITFYSNMQQEYHPFFSVEEFVYCIDIAQLLYKLKRMPQY